MENSWILAIIIPTGLLFIYSLIRIFSQFYILKLILCDVANTTSHNSAPPVKITIDNGT
ncbi:hypothetical protein EhV013 [Emiliania huxleyi virus 86]|uniref:Putative membrane protein n=1 Tax=Emiliania huxleyi virus 86 (isolate United Kingdom/English Channel/1999) TaxID=654925 RepID=Q4A3B6_EHV8U|nr:hypothetical protein EhV013 [Emiliania huxleyi virus 86]AEO97824.1 hypothetical protein ENVG_00126 [Emiliania huxleyi virus 84]AEP14949.1 hypothetical protein EOVG_00012 [Emiliania huxleyi virus 88]AHA55609.1 putative membrane protein [Emiliania huxleyi virus 164]CAI65436.1 putative membrane protein [Emiliania huxleyi virus 86]